MRLFDYVVVVVIIVAVVVRVCHTFFLRSVYCVYMQAYTYTFRFDLLELFVVLKINAQINVS